MRSPRCRARAGDRLRRWHPNAAAPSLRRNLLAGLHIQVAHKLTGKSPASFFEHATGINRMAFHRGRAFAVWQARREEVQAHADSLLARMMEKRGATDDERAAIREGMPSGLSKGVVFLMGLLDEATPFTHDLLGKLDESDVRLIQMADTNDLVGFSAEIGPSSELGQGFCEPLYVSGLTRLDLQLSKEERSSVIRTLTRRAHMALAFLAAVDHEIAQWNNRVPDGRGFLGALSNCGAFVDPTIGTSQACAWPSGSLWVAQSVLRPVGTHGAALPTRRRTAQRRSTA